MPINRLPACNFSARRLPRYRSSRNQGKKRGYTQDYGEESAKDPSSFIFQKLIHQNLGGDSVGKLENRREVVPIVSDNGDVNS